MSLNWIPSAATRDTAFFHLDTMIPAHLKYPLHSLLVRHGRGCFKCSANGVTSMDTFDGACPIRDLVGARGKSKSKSKGKKGGKKAKDNDDEDDVEAAVEKADQAEEEDLKQEVKDVVDTPVKSSGRTTRSGSATKVKKEAVKEVEKKPTIPKKAKKGSVAADEASMSGIMHGLDA